MFYLPRICEHCLNPSCMASCPSGAIYKRAEDGIVLVDQDRCRGWRQCVTGCPYKKIYFNHKTGKAEKCTLCYPRLEVGLPTVCSETCVGRLRYLGLFLYDADRVTAAAATPDEKDLYQAQLDLILDPNDPAVIAAARQQGIPADWLEAARRSPVYALAKKYKVALPLHPEYRTMPMVWYIPPLSPVVDLLRDQGHDAESPGSCSGRSERCGFRWSTWPSCSPPATPRDRARADGWPPCAPTCATSPSAAAGRLHRGLGGHDRPEYARDVPPAGHRQVRGALRHPEGARRAGPRARGARLLARLRRRAVRVRTVRRGQRPAVAGRGRDLPGAAATADLRRSARPATNSAAG